MYLTALQPLFHLFNQFLPSAATFLVMSAIMSSLPAKPRKKIIDDPIDAELERLRMIAAKNRATTRSQPSYPVKMYTIPTSMRPRA